MDAESFQEPGTAQGEGGVSSARAEGGVAMDLIILVRHGQSVENALGAGLGPGSHGDALTDLGRRQAVSCGGWLRSLGLGRLTLHTSPARRARETARLLGLGVPETVSPALSERSWGRWFEGVSDRDSPDRLAEARRAAGRDPWDWRPEEGESLRDVRARVTAWLSERQGRGAVVGVTHGEALLAARAAVEVRWRAWPLPLPGGGSTHSPPNGAALLYPWTPGLAPTRRGFLPDPMAADGAWDSVRWQEREPGPGRESSGEPARGRLTGETFP
ncbi:histidine phosphatase family protein [Streptomyces hainanensis]|uniref:Histidine phosphatase family protein n=1 Tax=Streptomyces hainanensis TaxID=402648 RepID=A0A4R4TXV3_9ACTN|nr:histidine phosphatase family protein [Streptomyces hainanensis]